MYRYNGEKDTKEIKKMIKKNYKLSSLILLSIFKSFRQFFCLAV